jgi:predicted MFS family arabinose efflux permease
LFSRSLGRWTDRVGAAVALRIGAVASALSGFTIATVVQSWTGLAIALSVAGLANALAQPAASRLLARVVRDERQGIAFGIFQSSKPVAGLLSGLAVPAIALTVGWRWAFALAAAVSLVAAALIPSADADRPANGPVVADAWVPRTAVMLLMIGMALGFGAVKVFGTFIVDAAVAAGMTPAAAGLLLAGGSALAITTRLVVGVVADRRGGAQLPAVVLMLVVGAVGFVLLAPATPATMVAGTVLVAGGAWGYNGLFYLSMTRLRRQAPAAITGVMLAGSSVGGVIGPIVFGVLAERSSYSATWGLVGAWTLVGAAAMGAAELRLRATNLVSATGHADG